MTATHLVEGHLGGMYLSQSDVADIEEMCESCGDSDMVVDTFDDADEDDVVRALTSGYADYCVYVDDEIYDEADVADDAIEELHEFIDEAYGQESVKSYLDMLDAEFYDYSSVDLTRPDWLKQCDDIRASTQPKRPITPTARERVGEAVAQMGAEAHAKLDADVAAWKAAHPTQGE